MIKYNNGIVLSFFNSYKLFVDTNNSNSFTEIYLVKTDQGGVYTILLYQNSTTVSVKIV